jgi:DHA2 family multidrug resistance protein-like MFS transporter
MHEPRPDDTTTASAPPRATRREWVGLAVIALPCAVYAMDLTVLNLALPAIAAELKPSAAQQLWIIDIYGFLVAGLLITMGTLGDRIGRRRLLLIGAALFAVASALAALSRSTEALIALRALLGVAGATLAPSTLSLIRNMFHDERQRQFAIGVWISSYSAGGALGPLVGGALIEVFHWSAVFWLAVPVMVLLLVVGPWLLPEYRDPQAGRVDLPSVALSLAAVLSAIYGIKHIAEGGVAPLPLAFVGAGLALGLAFVRRQSRLAYPLLDLALFRRPAFAAAIAAYAVSSLAMFGVYIFITQLLQLVLGLSPLQAGLATVPWALAFIAGSLGAPALVRRSSRLSVLVGGLLVAAAGSALLALAVGPLALAIVVTGSVVMSLGMAPVITVGNEIVVTSAPPERTGAASALSETSAEFSGALGIAIFGSVGTWLYASRLAAALPGAPAQALATLGGAIAGADTLPPAAGEALRGAARAAFADALQLVALISAALLVAAALAARRIEGSRGATVRAEAS